MIINEIDHLIYDYEAYAREYERITGKFLFYSDWVDLKTYYESKLRFINEIDYMIEDYDLYSIEFKLITGRDLNKEEWNEIRSYLGSREKIKQPVVEVVVFKEISDLFDSMHQYLSTVLHVESIGIIVKLTWAKVTRYITPDQFDTMVRMWRKAN